ncbi:MAG: diguanylate cyclase, partial [Lachnospiraceae bacterium]|nr:diguanylate cyclase [Lachnospiraceae bacterium]
MKRRDNKKNLRKMKSSHGVVSFLLFFLGLTLFLAVLASVLGVFLSNIISNKIDDEYSRISRDAEVYENSADDASLMSYLKMKDRIWIVRDRNGAVTAQNGEDSCGKEKQTIISASGIFSLITENRKLVGYEDTRDNALAASNGVINIDMGRISDMLTFSIFMGDEELPEPDDAHIRYLDQDMVKLPYWISIPLKDGNEFIGKAYFMIGTKDLMFLIGVILVLALFVLVMTVFLIGKLIRNIVRNRRISHIFYTDEVTKGKNRMWFLIKGEQFLKRRRYAGHSFAIVSISMIRYSNFCMCHSIAEGEALLTAVMDQLSRRMNKNEMAVHYGNAEFALLLFTDKEDQLKGRLNALLGLAERADPAHRCAFHAGVAILPPNIINAKIKRRKYLDLESVYNNACAARATLAEKEDSAVAFFDTKLLEEQRWIETVQEHQARALA